MPPVEEAQHDVQQINNGPSKGDQTRVIGEEITHARSEFTNPADYNAYLNSMKGSFSGNNDVLAAIDLYDSATAKPEQTVLQALTANNDELYRKLDTYGRDHGTGTNDDADRQIGEVDLRAFLADAGKEGTDAHKYAQSNPNVIAALTKLEQQPGEGFDKTGLLKNLGYSGDEASFTQFNNDHRAASGAVTLKNAAGKPEVIIEPNGISTALSYDTNGNINGINSSQKDANGNPVDVQLTRNEQGVFVNKDGQPGLYQAPFVDKDGNFGFYTQVEGNPNLYNKTTIKADGKVDNLAVDLNGKNPDGSPVAIAGLNRPLTVDGHNQQQFQTGRLDTHAIPLEPGQAVTDQHLGVTSQAGYDIAQGDNLYNVTRAALNLPKTYDGPDLEAAVDYLAKANGYTDRNQIPANAVLRIPPDFTTRAPLALPQPPVAVPA